MYLTVALTFLGIFGNGTSEQLTILKNKVRISATSVRRQAYKNSGSMAELNPADLSPARTRGALLSMRYVTD
jgi:hypothetical protein